MITDRIRESYDGERFTLTVAEIEARVASGRRRRRRLAVLAAAAVVAALTVTTALGQRRPDGPPPAVSWDESFERACAAAWPADRPRLPLGFTARSGERGIRIYLGDQASFYCVRMADGTTRSEYWSGGDLVPVPGTNIVAIGTGESSPDGVGWFYIGQLPDGFTTADVITKDGRVLRATVVGRRFMLWTPDDSLASSLTLRVHSEDGRTLVRLLPETRQAAQQCAEFLAGHGDPQRRFAFAGEDGRTLSLYGDDRVLIAVRDNGSGCRPLALIAGGRLFNSEFGHGYVFGRAPQGATSGVAVLRSGKRVPLSIQDGFFGAWWPTDDLHEVPVDVTFT